MAILTNPYTGSPRDIRDVESDPEGILIHKEGSPIMAAKKETSAACIHSAIAPNMNRCIRCGMTWTDEGWKHPRGAA